MPRLCVCSPRLPHPLEEGWKGMVEMSNRCPICAGIGRVMAFGACADPIPVPCPECAGLSVTPASADDVRTYTAAEITQMLLRRPALPPAMELPAVEEPRLVSDPEPEFLEAIGD